MSYFVYILECADGTFYTGYTNNLERRLYVHNNLKSAAHYTKIRRPVSLKYFETLETKGQALKRECIIKKLTKAEKRKLLGL
ncbi:MAG: GIY-YIG nuclease family protein [bacterium]